MTNTLGPAGTQGRPRAGNSSAREARPPRPLDRVMVEQIMSQLSLPLNTPGASVPLTLSLPRPAPNVFETPWAPGDGPAPWVASRPRERRRSKLPWLVVVMALAISAGLLVDKPARARAASQLHASRQHAGAFVQQHAAAFVHR